MHFRNTNEYHETNSEKQKRIETSEILVHKTATHCLVDQMKTTRNCKCEKKSTEKCKNSESFINKTKQNHEVLFNKPNENVANLKNKRVSRNVNSF